MENNAAQVVEHLHIDYPDLVKVNPNLIMLRFPGFGITGPYRHYKGYGANVEAVVGHTHLRGYRDADPLETSPIYHGDPTAGAHGAFAVLAALAARRRTGQGQLIDMSQAESVVHHLAHAFMDYSMNQRVQEPWGNRHPSMAPHNVYPCAGDDRWIAIAVPSDPVFAALCRVMGAEGLAQDPRYAAGPDRYRNQDELDPVIAAWTRPQDNRALMELLQAEGVPAVIVSDQREMLDDPHLKARGFFQEVTHPAAGTHFYPGPFAKLSGTPLSIRTPAPTLGQHNVEVFQGIVGLRDEEYAQLHDAGVIAETYAEDATA
ncbi:MAG: CoA transferase [Chloroflexi bacterium]|nr:CoA transferase [Chloroflexota bacterium]